MRAFSITIGQRGAPRLHFEAVAPDAFTALQQHVELRQEGERIEVAPVFTEEELLAADVERNTNKAQRRLARDVRAGVEDQAQRLRLVGGL